MTVLDGLRPQDYKKAETEDSDSVNKQDQQLTTDDEVASSNTQGSLTEHTII